MNRKTLGKIIVFISRIIDKTLRKKVLNETKHYPEPAVYSFWHGTEFSMFLLNQNSGIVIMVSLSKDGDLMAYVLESFGYVTVRGSSSRGGGKALLEIIRLAKEGKSLAFAADGPRGPYHKLKPGVIYAAQKTGMPLIL